MGKGPFLMEGGLGTISPCHLDDTMREEHIDAELMTITVLFYLGRLLLKTWFEKSERSSGHFSSSIVLGTRSRRPRGWSKKLPEAPTYPVNKIKDARPRGQSKKLPEAPMYLPDEQDQIKLGLVAGQRSYQKLLLTRYMMYVF